MRDGTCIVTLTMNPALDVVTRVDGVAPGRKLRCDAPRHEPGGAGIQAARVIHRMGGIVRAVFPAGGATGRRLASLLRSEGVPVHPIEAQADTRECFNVTDRRTGEPLRFVLPGEPLLEREWRDALERASDDAGECRWLIAGGSLPPGVPLDFYARLAARARAQDGRLVIDAPLDAAIPALRAGGLHIVRTCPALLREFAGEPLETDEALLDAARSLTRSGACKIVALTRGAEEAMLVTRDEALRAAPLPATASCGIGAGSSFTGALVQSLAGGRDLRAAFATAMAAGAAALLAPPGAAADAAQVERLREQVWVR